MTLTNPDENFLVGEIIARGPSLLEEDTTVQLILPLNLSSNIYQVCRMHVFLFPGQNGIIELQDIAAEKDLEILTFVSVDIPDNPDDMDASEQLKQVRKSGKGIQK